MNRTTLQQLIDRVKDLKVFKRNKKPIQTKLISALIYNSGLSCRKTSGIVSLVNDISHESVRLWHKVLSKLLPKVKPKYRETIAVDETKLKVNGIQVYVWGCIDVKTREILGIKVTRGRSYLEAYLFLREVLQSCTNKPTALTDRGPWYPWPIRTLNMKQEHVTFGLRNKIERWFRTLKERTKRFYNNINCKSLEQGIECLQAFLNSFVALYNFTLSP